MSLKKLEDPIGHLKKPLQRIILTLNETLDEVFRVELHEDII